MTRRLLATVALLGLVAVSAPAQADPQEQGHTHLNSVGERQVGEAIPIIGYLVGTNDRHDKTIYLQRKVDDTWRTVDFLVHRADGRFKFRPSRHVNKPQMTRWRVVVKSHGVKLHASEVLKVKVVAKPIA